MSDKERAVAVARMYEGYAREFPAVPVVSPDSLRSWMRSTGTLLVDVRDARERRVSVIPGAVSPAVADSLLPTADRVVLYCTIGYRSGRRAEQLRREGITAYNLEAGILGWVHHGGTVVHDGHTTNEVHVYGRQWSLLPQAFRAVW